MHRLAVPPNICLAMTGKWLPANQACLQQSAIGQVFHADSSYYPAIQTSGGNV